MSDIDGMRRLERYMGAHEGALPPLPKGRWKRLRRRSMEARAQKGRLRRAGKRERAGRRWS